MMGGQFSKKKGVANPTPPPPPPPPLKINSNSQYTADLTSYEDACMLDPDLQAFDTTLHERTNRVLNSLSTGVEVRSLSFNSLKEVTNCLLDMNQDVVNVILQCKEDIWDNKELSALVKEYFESSAKTLDFCAALESCLKRARNSQLIIQVALRRFEEEVALHDGVVETKYVKTLEELRNFKAAGDPFTDEFYILFQSVYRQQVSMLQKLQLRKKKLDKKMKSMKTWRRVSNVLFVSAFVSVLIFSVVAAAIAAPPVVTALAGALAVPIGSVGKWCNSLWNGYMKALKGQKELVSSMQVGTFIVIQDMDNIRILVNKLEAEIDALLQNVNIALINEDAFEIVKIVIDDIKKKLEEFMQTIEDLGEHASKCSHDITQARTVILQRIIRYPDR
ncbi:UPF0496 protein At2g18630 isoform X1 [Ricinus communis]|uniref:AT14A, putative n=1 Tax=Ricinus communis TaxID=3988 RepID=B9SGH6_RICCO|nr:UPF0496 protein At2g18630 isoform X1 [Ricinus communis]EEF37222.1 AT14A, putative [Ricinus communis]|eukprot:XP_002525095.1 UPF0496 protein At2g18630 [Ricinus communis]